MPNKHMLTLALVGALAIFLGNVAYSTYQKSQVTAA